MQLGFFNFSLIQHQFILKIFFILDFKTETNFQNKKCQKPHIIFQLNWKTQRIKLFYFQRYKVRVWGNFKGKTHFSEKMSTSAHLYHIFVPCNNSLNTFQLVSFSSLLTEILCFFEGKTNLHWCGKTAKRVDNIWNVKIISTLFVQYRHIILLNKINATVGIFGIFKTMWVNVTECCI